MGFIERIMSFATNANASADATAGEEKTSKANLRSPVEESLLARLHQASDQSYDTGEAQGDPAPLRLHLRFIGTVQGVGFRWTNQGIANQLSLAGWVRNNDDGSVEMEIQGPPAAIAAHLDAVHAYYHRFNNRIWLDEELECTPQADGNKFEVRY